MASVHVRRRSGRSKSYSFQYRVRLAGGMTGIRSHEISFLIFEKGQCRRDLGTDAKAENSSWALTGHKTHKTNPRSGLTYINRFWSYNIKISFYSSASASFPELCNRELLCLVSMEEFRTVAPEAPLHTEIAELRQRQADSLARI